MPQKPGHEKFYAREIAAEKRKENMYTKQPRFK